MTGGAHAAEPMGASMGNGPDLDDRVRDGNVGGTTGAARPEDRSVGELLGEVTKDLSTLMRQEVELAKAEIREEATKAGKASAMLGGAGLAGLLLTIFVSLALMYALASFMPIGWAALIVAVLWGIVGAILYSTGRKRLSAVRPVPERTVETLKEDARWARHPAS